MYKLLLVLVLLCSGCARPTKYVITRVGDTITVSTDKEDTDFFGNQKPLPNGIISGEVSEKSSKISIDTKPDYKVMEFVVNKNQGV